MFEKLKKKMKMLLTKMREAKYAANKDVELVYATTAPEDDVLTHDQVMQLADEKEARRG